MGMLPAVEVGLAIGIGTNGATGTKAPCRGTPPGWTRHLLWRHPQRPPAGAQRFLHECRCGDAPDGLRALTRHEDVTVSPARSEIAGAINPSPV